MKNLKGVSEMQSKTKTPTSNKQPYKHRDDRLLSLQKHYTNKIIAAEQAHNDALIRHYLYLCQQVAQQRLALQKREAQ